MTGKLLGKNLLSRILYDVSGRRLLSDEQFVFIPKRSTVVHHPRLVQRFSMNFDEKRLTGAVFLDVVKVSDTAWVDCLLYKLTIRNFPSYLIKNVSSHLNSRTFEVFFQTATSTSRRMRSGVVHGGIS
jgi:hypothetical protein